MRFLDIRFIFLMTLAVVSFSCKRSTGWGFGITDQSGENFQSVGMIYDGKPHTAPINGTMSTGGDMPSVIDFLFTTKDGVTHLVHVQIPTPPQPPPGSLDTSGIPDVFFIIRNPDKIDVTFKNPILYGG
jgi:hypothetical protein